MQDEEKQDTSDVEFGPLCCMMRRRRDDGIFKSGKNKIDKYVRNREG